MYLRLTPVNSISPRARRDLIARCTVDSEQRAILVSRAMDWHEFSPSELAASASASSTTNSLPTAVECSHTHVDAVTLTRHAPGM
jgi:hypothetical protein